MSMEPSATKSSASEHKASDAAEEEGEFPRPFGPFVLLHPLARGGMGNVLLAKTVGTAGIEKHCVVKTLRERYTHDPDYVRRFVDEARVVVQLSHRNICPVFDVGRIGNSYYLAMELVVGTDARTLLSALARRGRNLPPALGVHIACELLDALDYAHRHQDPVSGEPLHLVHRDVSPQNVMINAEGEVKLIDFGLAETGRTVSADEPVNTGTSVVMGKIAYMSPEQARGDLVDARGDQFSAAVVAYELITSKRYYEGLTTQQVWSQAGLGVFRPAAITELDPALRTILEQALAAHARDRFATCGDFREALLEYARRQDLRGGNRELRTVMHELFQDDFEAMRQLLQRFQHVSNRARPGFMAAKDAAQHDEVFSIATSTLARSRIHDPTEMLPRAELAQPPDTTVAGAPLSSRQGRTALAIAAAGVAALIGVVVIAALVPSTGPVAQGDAGGASALGSASGVVVEPGNTGGTDPVADAGALAALVADAGAALKDPIKEVRVVEPPRAVDDPPKKRPPKPKDPPKKNVAKSGGTTITDTIRVLSACRKQQPCAGPLADRGAYVSSLSFAELVQWKADAKRCIEQCR